jgi:hypothetical protein
MFLGKSSLSINELCHSFDEFLDIVVKVLDFLPYKYQLVIEAIREIFRLEMMTDITKNVNEARGK